MRFEVVGHGGDGVRDQPGLFGRGRDILNPWVEPDLLGVGVNDQPPGAGEEAVDALDTLHAPRLDRFERSHEHLVEPQAISAVFLDHGVGVDHVAPALRHLVRAGVDANGWIARQDEGVALLDDLLGFEPDHRELVVGLALVDELIVQMLDLGGRDPMAGFVLVSVVLGLAQDHPLVDKLLEWLGSAHVAAVVEHLVPEPAVEQMKHGMLGAADIEVDRHPVAFELGIDEPLGVLGVDVAQVVPARAGPLGHRVGLADVAVGVVDPVGRLAERRFGLAAGAKVVEVGQPDGKFGDRNARALSRRRGRGRSGTARPSSAGG